jgi:polar amino acid transport system permease protein
MSFTDTFLNGEVLLQALPLLLQGVLVTLKLAGASILFGMPVGLVLCLLRLYAPRPIAALAVIYIDVLRAMPMLVLLILIYFGLPFVGVRFSSFAAATLGLSMALAAFAAEIFRAGIQGVPKGQVEAANALGLHFLSTMRLVVLPQAIRLVIPPLTSNCIGIVKETSLASTVALSELLKQGNDAQALTANPTPLLGVAAIYLVILWPLVRIVDRLEHRSRARAAR